MDVAATGTTSTTIKIAAVSDLHCTKHTSRAGALPGEPNPTDLVPGRIPGSINAPWPDLPPSNKLLLGELGKLRGGEIVAYCGSGVTACVTLHRLALAGRDGRLYPGSWSEWEQRDELPREQG